MNFKQSRIEWLINGGWEKLYVDNVTADAGAGGATFAADDIGGVHYPRTKIAWGVDGAAVDASASNPFPVVQIGTPALPTGAATLAEQQSQTTALQIIDDWDESDRAKVNPIVGQAGVAAGAGAVGATVQRVTLASDDPGVVSLALIDDVIKTDDAAFSPGTDKVAMVGATFDDVTPDSVNEGDAGALRMSANRNLYGTIRDAAGNERGANVTAGNALLVDASATTQPVSAASLPLPTGAATLAEQQTQTTSLQLLDNLVLAEDAAHQSGDPGIQSFAVRNDSDASLAGTTGDYTPLQVDANGYLKVNIKAGAGSGGTALADKAAFTEGTTSHTPIGGVYNETISADPTEDQAAAVRITAKRAIHVNLRDSAGAELTAGAQYAEDAVHASGDMLTMAGAVRRDTAAVGSGADGDNSTFNVDNAGRLWARIVGDSAHDAAISGSPVRVAGRGMSADFAAVATGDTVDLLASLLGKLVILTDALPANTWSYAAPAGGLVTTSGVTAKAAAGAGIRNYVSKIQFMNSHQTIGTEVVIRDGAAGTVLWRGWAQFPGGGAEVEFKPPLRGTANTLIEIAEVTTTATAGVLVNLQGFVAAE